MQTHNPSQLINDNFWIIFKVALFASNIKKEVCDVLESFFSFKKRYEKTKTYNMQYDVFDARPYVLKPSFNYYF